MYLNLDIYIYYEYIYIHYIVYHSTAPNPSKFAGSCDACISVSMANSPLLRGEPVSSKSLGFVWNTWIITMFWVGGDENLIYYGNYQVIYHGQMILDDFGLIKLLSWPSQDWEIHVHHFKIVLAIIFFRTNPLVSSQCSKALTEVDEKWLLRTSKQMKDHINSYRQDSPYKFCISIIHSPPKQVYICLMHVQATIGVSHGTAEFSNSWHLPSQSDSCRCMCICNIYIIYI